MILEPVKQSLVVRVAGALDFDHSVSTFNEYNSFVILANKGQPTTATTADILEELSEPYVGSILDRPITSD